MQGPSCLLVQIRYACKTRPPNAGPQRQGLAELFSLAFPSSTAAAAPINLFSSVLPPALFTPAPGYTAVGTLLTSHCRGVPCSGVQLCNGGPLRERRRLCEAVDAGLGARRGTTERRAVPSLRTHSLLSPYLSLPPSLSISLFSPGESGRDGGKESGCQCPGSAGKRKEGRAEGRRGEEAEGREGAMVAGRDKATRGSAPYDGGLRNPPRHALCWRSPGEPSA